MKRFLVICLTLISLIPLGCSSDDSSQIADGDIENPENSDQDSNETSEIADESEEKTPPTCDAEKTGKIGKQTINISFAGEDRSYVLYVPENYDSKLAVPLVLNIHGFSSNSNEQVLFSDMLTNSEESGFIIAYPEGIENSWNSGMCCGEALKNDLDDVGFLKAIVQDIKKDYCINEKRVYATGMSNGGFMSHRLGCEAADIFAAVAPVTGILGLTDCMPSRPMPIVMYNGTTDKSVDYDGALKSFAKWKEINNCKGEPVVTKHGNSKCEAYKNCDGGVEVILCSLDPMGHCWPGSKTAEAICEIGKIGPYNGEIIANTHMWDFFMKYELP